MQKEVEQYIRSLSDIDLLEYTRTDTYLPEAANLQKRSWLAGILPLNVWLLLRKSWPTVQRLVRNKGSGIGVTRI